MTENHNYYLDKAQSIIEKSCLKRNYGCVIVKNNEIISSGRTITPEGVKSCTELGYCHRSKVGGTSNEYNYCLTCHAEQESIIYPSIDKLRNSTMYLVCLDSNDNIYDKAFPCNICRRLIQKSNISKLVIRVSSIDYIIEKVSDWDLQTLKFQH